MAPLTAAQRNALPNAAFAFVPKRRPGESVASWHRRRKYPAPTAGQARRAGISEVQRQRTLRNAAARGAQRHTAGSYRTVAPVAKRRSRPAGPMRGLTRAGARRPVRSRGAARARGGTRGAVVRSPRTGRFVRRGAAA